MTPSLLIPPQRHVEPPSAPLQADVLSIWIVEDNDLLRESIALIINQAPGLTCPLDVATCEEALLALDDGAVRIEREGKVQKFVLQVEHITFSGRRARRLGQRITYVTERCVLRLEDHGLTVTEIAPGIDLDRDVLGQTALPLRISPDLRVMDERLFRPEPMGLVLESV